MDDFRKAQAEKIGHGGFHCPCCNDYRKHSGKRKLPGLSKVARAALKKDVRRYAIQLEE